MLVQAKLELHPGAEPCGYYQIKACGLTDPELGYGKYGAWFVVDWEPYILGWDDPSRSTLIIDHRKPSHGKNLVFLVV